MTERINSLPDFASAFNDHRIDKRAAELVKNYAISRKSAISKISNKFSEQKAYYRLLENTKFAESIIISRTTSKCNQNSLNRHVLALNDTVDFNLDSHKGRVTINEGFGLSSNSAMGFKLHSSLIIDAQSLFPIGFSSIDIWNRPFDKPLKQERSYKTTEIEAKESYKWIKSIDATVRNTSNASSITFVSDRESDIYDVLAKSRAPEIHFVIRSKSDRSVSSKMKLREHLSQITARFSYDVQIEGDLRKNSKTRQARLSVKYSAIELVKPQSCKDKKLPASVWVNVVEVSEETESKTKIHWLLYTTHRVNTDEEAAQIIQWYRARWNIEQVHRLLKTEGLEIEKTQIEKADSIKKLLVLALSATLRVLQLNIAYSKELEQDVDVGFDKSEQEFLCVLNAKLEGETQKLKNPFKQRELRWATWIIARLGDWKGYKTQRPPGVITLQKGLVKFYHMLDGWAIAQEIFMGKR